MDPGFQHFYTVVAGVGALWCPASLQVSVRILGFGFLTDFWVSSAPW